MNKERIKGMAIGFVLCLVLSTGVIVAANSQTVTREITYGIGVMLNGEIVQFDSDSRPFVMDGRTFLPLRTISELLGLPVDFDPTTNTAIVGSRYAASTRRPLNDVAPFFDGGTPSFGTGANAVVRPGESWPRAAAGWDGHISVDDVTMGGRVYTNATRFFSRPWHGNGTNMFVVHNLDSQYRMLTGHFGRIDDSGLTDATVVFLGDGVELARYTISSGNLPVDVSVFVEGVRQLRVNVSVEHTPARLGNRTDVSYALSAFLE